MFSSRSVLLTVALVACSSNPTLQEKENSAPVAVIEFPETDSTFSVVDSIEFRGLVSDADANDISVVTWSSDLDGLLSDQTGDDLSSDGRSVHATTLSQGIHTITLFASDFAGEEASDFITVVVDSQEQLPTAEIVEPANLSEYNLGDPIAFTGEVSDPNQSPDSLAVVWTLEPSDGSADPIELFNGSAASSGVTTTSWDSADVGNWVARLTVTDDDANTATSEIVVLVADPDDADLDGDGYSVNQGDCDDADPTRSPGEVEACDEIDNDCNGLVDDDLTFQDYYEDFDGDGYGDFGGAPTNACIEPGPNFVTDNTDCDEGDPTVNPGQAETTCDGIDNDCDPATEDAPDADGDTYTVCDGDCDETNNLVYPGAAELCDATDNDCDGGVDEDVTYEDWYVDNDGDGAGDPTTTPVNACDPQPGRAPSNTDCDDDDPNNFGGNTEICDGEDNDCTGLADDGLTYDNWYPDVDRDGYGDNATGAVFDCISPSTGPLDVWVNVNGDCDDSTSAASPGNPAEITCNGIDDDCLPDSEDNPDADGDGTSVCLGDCDDADPNNYPTNPEICDGQDNDCDGAPDDGLTFVDYYPDTDNDGFGDPGVAPTNACEQPAGFVVDNTDCDDTLASSNPGLPETTCDSIDNDCNPATLDAPDADGDGFTVCAGDCDDSLATVYPGNPEVCDGLDNDCSGVADNGLPFTNYYADADGDGYGNASSVENDCAAPSGYVSDATDCDDTQFGVNPGQPETTCDGIDNDCTGATVDTPDADADGIGLCTGDCADNDPAVFPGAVEDCTNGLDDDCDGDVDLTDSDTLGTADCDSDGLTYDQEVSLGYAADDADSNDNGINDGDEDADFDGVTNDEEYDVYGTDPANADTDGGGIIDGVEIFNDGTNPNLATDDASIPATPSIDSTDRYTNEDTVVLTGTCDPTQPATTHYIECTSGGTPVISDTFPCVGGTFNYSVQETSVTASTADLQCVTYSTSSAGTSATSSGRDFEFCGTNDLQDAGAVGETPDNAYNTGTFPDTGSGDASGDGSGFEGNVLTGSDSDWFLAYAPDNLTGAPADVYDFEVIATELNADGTEDATATLDNYAVRVITSLDGSPPASTATAECSLGATSGTDSYRRIREDQGDGTPGYHDVPTVLYGCGANQFQNECDDMSLYYYIEVIRLTAPSCEGYRLDITHRSR